MNALLLVLSIMMAANDTPATPAATRPATTAPALPPGNITQMAVGTLFVPSDFPRGRSRIDLLVHFHGDLATVARQFVTTRRDAVLIDITYPGLSAAYSGPFKDPTLFGRVLDDGLAQLKASGVGTPSGRWGHICVSSFSAGYGAVREILKSPDYLKRIDAVYAADSLYAGYVGDPSEHQVDPENMTPFRQFAAEAAAGRKTFILTHSYLVPGKYASTIETADDLIRHVGGKRVAVDKRAAGGMQIISECHVGNFHVYGCAGEDGQAHMQHLRNMANWLPELPLGNKATSAPSE